ncbi:hypothetical protein [Leuconostoc kimchii]|uniref:hypothetical protein n=1 Tax=Leuconostoc kimchii TaxID=136609 RepID=UPI001FAB282F|nr:hypothetical protein [Leuconostoc kimchii]
MNTKNDRSLIHDMSDVVKGPSSVVIPAIHLKMWFFILQCLRHRLMVYYLVV